MKNAARAFVKRTTRRSGFTLLELLIAVGLTSLLMISLFSALQIYFDLQMDSHEEKLHNIITESKMIGTKKQAQEREEEIEKKKQHM